MGVQVCGDIEAGCLYDSVTMTAFGPVFEDRWEAEDFLEAYDRTGTKDLRRLEAAELVEVVESWRDGRRAPDPGEDDEPVER